MKNILITGSAGFIGFSVSKYFLEKNINVLGIDNLNNYYDKNLKLERLKILKTYANYEFLNGDISKKKTFNDIKKKIDLVINLAAQVGVRFSISKPEEYIKSNINGFLNVINFCNKNNIKRIYFASSSSVYGNNKKYPYKETYSIAKPLQFYAITKATNELMAFAYSKLFNIKFTGFRFFTVYGPFGRPDMAIYKFSKNIFYGSPIEVYGNGQHLRDITYIDDIVTAIYKVVKKDQNNLKEEGYKIFNIGGGSKIKIIDIIRILEKLFNKSTEVIFKDKISADMLITESSNHRIEKYIGALKRTDPKNGLKKFVNWFLKYEKK